MSRPVRTLLAAAIGAALLAAAPAYAANDAMLALLKVLKEKGTLDEATYESLVNAAKADDEHVTFANDEIKRMQKETPKIDTKDKIKVSSPDGDFEWQLIGRLMADYHVVDSDTSQIDTEGNIRRARLGMQGKLWKHWIWKLEYDFADSTASLKDGYVGYEDKYSKGDWWVKAGQHHIPFGLATMSSSKYLTLLERPLMADGELQPARNLGVSGFVNGGDKWTFQAGTFGASEVSDPGTFEELNIAARATFNPYIKDKTHLTHVGGAVWYRDPNDTTVQIRQRPGVIRAADARFIDANFGPGNIEDILAFNAEALTVWGPLHLQGEYTNWDVSPNGTAFNGSDDVTLDGYYVEAGWFLTGESMSFKPAEGLFSGVKPSGIVGKGGIGAWQIAARYDVMDLDDFTNFLAASTVGSSGGREKDVRVGLNWYPTNTVRFMADYVTVLDLDRAGHARNNDEPSSFNVRAMLYW